MRASTYSNRGYDFGANTSDAFNLYFGAGESGGNESPADWVPYFQNPWIEPGTLVVTDEGQFEKNPDAHYVDRSRAALRKWMDENPY